MTKQEVQSRKHAVESANMFKQSDTQALEYVLSEYRKGAERKGGLHALDASAYTWERVYAFTVRVFERRLTLLKAGEQR